jgi:hypothetical protein
VTGANRKWLNEQPGVTIRRMFGHTLVLVFTGAVMSLGIAGNNYWKHRVHAGWLAVKGHIETSDLRNDQKDSHLLEMRQGAALVAEVGYSYLVGGAYYSGHSDVVFSDEAEAWTYINRHCKGDSVCVYYDPRNPEHSAIEPGTVRVGKYLGAGLGFLLLGILVLLTGEGSLNF